MRGYDILTCGSATIDVFAHTDNEIQNIKCHGKKQEMLVYPVGTKLIIEKLEQHVGGGGTNTAAAISTYGDHVGYIGAVGDDANGHNIVKELEKRSISFLGHFVSDMSGYSVILDSVSHDRTILTYKGANNALSFQKINTNITAKGLYCSSMMGKAFTAQKKLCMWAKQKKMLVCYNPSSYQAKLGLAKMKSLFHYIDVLIFNREEAQLLLGSDEKAAGLLKQLQKYVPTVIITDGPHPMYAVHKGEEYKITPSKVKVKEATGAGDAFASTTFAAMLQGFSFENALLHGLANAQSVISACGAKNGLLSRKQIENYIKKRKLHTCVKHFGTLI